MSGLRFAVLGAVRAWRDGYELDLGGPAQRAFLALLLVRANRVVPITEVLHALWADRPPPRAAAQVRLYAARLRRTLGPEVIVGGDGHFLARVDPSAVDLHAGRAPLWTPAQLPADLADFTGRRPELARLRTALTADTGRVCVVTGTAGVGKTALAVHLAHGLRPRFPDGQLYADLGLGGGADPSAVLGGFLRALGVAPGMLPPSLMERARLYRALLTRRRMLVLLDDARDDEQIDALLPGTPRSAAVVTGRARLPGLAADERVRLGELPLGDALTLLAAITGAERVAVEFEAAVDVVRHCGRLPLALRIAGGRLAARPTWTLARLAARLADGTRRLEELRTGDSDVAAAFRTGYRTLQPQPAAALRRLAGHPRFSAAEAAEVLRVPQERAEALCETLVDAGLLDSPASGVYHNPELLRLFAATTVEPGLSLCR
ncbi:NB-ARC domain-containing protein [Nonomuraea typhae]|uniref:NB-ARC domain-containing protein n=1 Tax=Nonomuraea typhae TaxID=2603600 RepID=UPI0015E23A32|nr:NB-ARC domain-containing protein [Nonomuraea typhae]